MYLSVHATVGAIVGQQTGNPILAFGAGFASHLLLDIIPHGDGEKSGMPQTNKTIMIAASIDLTALTLITLWLYRHTGGTIFSPTLIAGALGGMLPDALQLPYLLSNGRKWNWYQRIHNFFHNMIVSKWDIPYPIGIILQTLLVIGLVTTYNF